MHMTEVGRQEGKLTLDVFAGTVPTQQGHPRTLIDWYRAGLDAERELPKLATYLGHVHVKNTYWYLDAVPELMQLTIARLIQREAQP